MTVDPQLLLMAGVFLVIVASLLLGRGHFTTLDAVAALLLTGIGFTLALVAGSALHHP